MRQGWQGWIIAGVAVLVAGCDSPDPAEGGFFNGVAGIAGGGYDARVAEREQGVAEARATNAALTAELAALQGEHARLKRQIVAQRAAIRAEGGRLTPASEARIQTALTSKPGDAAGLRKAIADARALSAELARLSG